MSLLFWKITMLQCMVGCSELKISECSMTTFQSLVDVIDKLLSPEGCPWDQEQTLLSMRGSLLEEACELIEAIDLGDPEHIKEELGDLLFNAVFLCRLAEKESKCSLEDVLREITEKMIRRHPHVYGNAKNISNSDQVLDQWNKIKSGENGKSHRKSILDDVPKGLPALARGQKVLKKMHKHHFHPEQKPLENTKGSDELAVGQELISLIVKAQKQGIDAEQALRMALAHHEQAFRKIEST